MKKEELKKLLESGEHVRILDVREAEELEGGPRMIEGAEHVPMGKVFVKVQKGELPKEGKIVTVCKTGGRCDVVARELRGKGYDIESLEGGLDEWHKE